MQAHLYYFYKLKEFIRDRRPVWYLVAMVFILPGFIFEGGSLVMNTIGLTSVNAGFGILVILALDWSLPSGQGINNLFYFLMKAMAFTGLVSYNIYIWHIKSLGLIRHIYVEENYIQSLLYLLLAIMVGTVFSTLIERPILLYRNRVFKKSYL